MNGEYHYHLEGTSFDALAMIAVRCLLAPSFFCQQGNFKRIPGTGYLMGSVFMSLKRL